MKSREEMEGGEEEMTCLHLQRRPEGNEEENTTRADTRQCCVSFIESGQRFILGYFGGIGLPPARGEVVPSLPRYAPHPKVADQVSSSRTIVSRSGDASRRPDQGYDRLDLSHLIKAIPGSLFNQHHTF